MPNLPTEWNGAITLEDYVISIFKKKGTDSSEFRVLLRIFGRDKLLDIWNKYQQERGNKKKRD